MKPPILIVHADWSLRPEKRWLCIAEPLEDGSLQMSAPEAVGPPDSLIRRLVNRAKTNGVSTHVLLGLDVPIGLPRAYATTADIDSFLDVLPRLGHGEWADFYNAAERPDEISQRRPFYPMRPGGATQKHLADGLGVDGVASLLREAECPTTARGAAAPLFWTMGAQQVGKAAITAWKEILAPALSNPAYDVAIWPFQGSLADLVVKHEVTIAEVYPAEACVQLELGAPGRGWSKRSRGDRRRHADALATWATSRRVELAPELSALMQNGFGDQSTSEDWFDATVSVLSMIDVVHGHRPAAAPNRPEIRNIEGWILGRTE